MEPKVSVIIPTYNRHALLTRAINSVLSQSYHDLEVIVVDDGSIQDASHRIPGLPVRYIYQDHAGAAVARNRGIDEAMGKYIAFLDSDDQFVPDKLEKQVALMDANPNVILSHTSYIRNERVVCSGSFAGDVYPRLYFRCPVAMSTVMIQTRFLQLQEYHFQEGIHGNDDLILWAKLARLAPIGALREPLTIISTGKNTSAFSFKLRVNSSRNVIEHGIKKDDYLGPVTQLTLSLYWHILGMVSPSC